MSQHLTSVVFVLMVGLCQLGCISSDKRSCVDECEQSDIRSCDGQENYRICGQYDDDDCLELSGLHSCGPGKKCSNGQCSDDCQNECANEGDRQCNGEGFQLCGFWDSDPCLEWSMIIPCDEETRCELGVCQPIPELPDGWVRPRCGDHLVDLCSDCQDRPLICHPCSNRAVCVASCADECGGE